MGNSIEIAVRQSKRLETLLEERLGATGKGLHEKLSSVENQLPSQIVKTVRWIASVRNAAVHEADYEIAKPDEFNAAAERVAAHLESISASKRSPDSWGLSQQRTAPRPSDTPPPPRERNTRPHRSGGRGRRSSNKLGWAVLVILLAVALLWLGQYKTQVIQWVNPSSSMGR